MGRPRKEPDHYLFVTMTADPPSIEWRKCTREEVDTRLETGGAHFIVIAGGEPVEPRRRYELVPVDQLMPYEPKPRKPRIPRKPRTTPAPKPSIKVTVEGEEDSK